MRSLLRLAEDMQRLALTRSPFYEYPWAVYRLPSVNQVNRWERYEEAAQPKIGKDGYQVSMDVGHFKPSELKVKVVDDSVIVEGKFEDREDDKGFISKHFVRRYTLPKGYEADKAVSTLSSDGVLTVSVPKPQQLEDKSNEREIPIQQTGPADLNIKDNPTEDGEEKTNEKLN